jgi:hypothetical protein
MPHLQGYVEFIVPVKKSTMEAALGGRAWIQKAAGSRRQNLAYCRKQGNIFLDFLVNDKTPHMAVSKFARILNNAKALTPHSQIFLACKSPFQTTVSTLFCFSLGSSPDFFSTSRFLPLPQKE